MALNIVYSLLVFYLYLDFAKVICIVVRVYEVFPNTVDFIFLVQDMNVVVHTHNMLGICFAS